MKEDTSQNELPVETKDDFPLVIENSRDVCI